MDTILVLDVGLTNAKCALFDLNGTLLGCESVPYPTTHPRPGQAEQDPDHWWRAAVEGVNALRRKQHPLHSVRAISVTGHMHSLVCVDGSGTPTRPAIVLGDSRGATEAATLVDQLGKDWFHRRTGARLDASMPLAKLCWMRQHEPEPFLRSRHFLTCKDYLRSQLTGDRLTDPMDATGMSLYDLNTDCWSPELCDLAGIAPGQLPALARPWDQAGRLLPEPAAALALPPGIPVVVGAGDDVEVLGFGIIEPGQALEHFGTTGSILATSAEPRFDPACAVEVYPHVIPGRWLLGGSISSAGAARAWAKRCLQGGAEQMPVPPVRGEPLLFLPHLAGARCPQWNPQARGAWFGLAPHHGPAELFQAVIEGVTFALRSVADAMEQLGQSIPGIRISPHHGESPDWLALRAAAYNRQLNPVLSPEPTALGAMMLAAMHLGVFQDLDEAVATIVKTDGPLFPQQESAEIYAQHYARFRQVDDALQQVYGVSVHAPKS